MFWKKLNGYIQDSIVSASQGQVLFYGIGASGTFDAFAEIKQQNIAEELMIHEYVKEPEAIMAPSLQSSSHESWAPYRGGTIVNRGYLFNDFYFNNVSAFDSRSTYEHETQVYDCKYADYDGYWSSNMPRAYKDTQLLDGKNIDNFTVGCAQASAIKTYKRYYGYMALRPQNRNIRPTVRIKGQLGRRQISWCYSTWCIFPKDTSDTMIKFNAPMLGICWRY